MSKTKTKTLARVRELQSKGEDFEWYPTTDTIIAQVATDIEENFYHSDKILDVGAGDGRVLVQLSEKFRRLVCFAIEKAPAHIAAMPKDIQMLGTDFWGQTLVDKKMDIIFCNPPYSEYERWARRLIWEANTDVLYLVIPLRWRESEGLQRVVKSRNMEVTSLGMFNFTGADRQARAKVEVVRFHIPERDQDNTDAFIEEMLPQLSVFDLPPAEKPLESEMVRSLVEGGRGLIEVLIESHDKDVALLVQSYNSLGEVDPALLASLEITKHVVLNLIRGKIQATKKRYWELLFNELDTVRKRMATEQRRAYVNRMNSRACIDFTEENILAVLVWVTKWANDDFDAQTVALFQALSCSSSCAKYKSNEKVWTQQNWRYSHMGKEAHKVLGPYKLEYRMVISHGGICTSAYSWDQERAKGLENYSAELLEDIIVTANNLHFDCDDNPRRYEWRSGKSNTLLLKNGEPLVEVKAFMNGNMHFRFNPKFMLALNIEAGRLLGWIRNPAEACQELKVPPEDAAQVEQMFGSAFRIGLTDGPRLLTMC